MDTHEEINTSLVHTNYTKKLLSIMNFHYFFKVLSLIWKNYECLFCELFSSHWFLFQFLLPSIFFIISWFLPLSQCLHSLPATLDFHSKVSNWIIWKHSTKKVCFYCHHLRMFTKDILKYRTPLKVSFSCFHLAALPSLTILSLVAWRARKNRSFQEDISNFSHFPLRKCCQPFTLFRVFVRY